MTIAIHQPNFFPWLPFFLKMSSVDVFVILNHCQFEKNNYQNRFFYRDSWRTMSVNHGLVSICEKRYANHTSDWQSIKQKLSDKREILDQFDNCIDERLSTCNLNIIKKVSNMLNISTEIVLDEQTNLRSNERLIWLCKKFGAKQYLAGSGGVKYMNIEAFNNAGVDVHFQNVSDVEKIHVLDVIKQ